jgi:glycosyltransferase involved in cell wall biosynthesis
VDILVLSENTAPVIPDHLRYGIARYDVYQQQKIPFTLSSWRTVLSHPYQHIFCDHVNLSTALAPLSMLFGKKYTVWLHGLEIFPPRPDREGRIGLRFAARRLTSSEYTRTILHQRFPDLPAQTCDLALDPVRHPLELPVEPVQPSQPVFLPAITGEMMRLGDQVILHVGHMVLSDDRYKGQESLLQAFPLIRHQYPQAQLVLIGQGEDISRIRALAYSLPAALQAGVFMPGYIPDQLLDQIYRSCYVFAMPSIGEGFGLVYLEAMSRGKPCLGARVDATPCVVRDSLTGLLVNDPKSPEQVAEALNWFLSHPEETHRMGLAGYELVKSYYLFPHFKERFWKALSD